jgi:hypothetical protein
MGETAGLKMPFQHQHPFALQLCQQARDRKTADPGTDDDDVWRGQWSSRVHLRRL